jgi:hypothetical protein
MTEKTALPPEVSQAIDSLNSYMADEFEYHEDNCDGTRPCAWERWVTIIQYLRGAAQ